MGYNNRFNYQQGQQEGGEANIQASDASFHEIRTYNDTKDKIWIVGAEINNTQDIGSLLLYLNDLYMLLMRADKVWWGVEYSVREKASRMKSKTVSFKYSGQMAKYSNKIKTYIDYVENNERFMEEHDAGFDDYMNLPSAKGKLRFLKKKATDLIGDVADEWEQLAAKIDFTMPLELREGRDPFFRIAEALQINYTTEDYELYKKVAKRGIKKLAFMNALYKVRENGHIPCAISGEFNHGKSTTEIILAVWDTNYTRMLLKKINRELYEMLKASVRCSTKDNIIISPKDPASKFIINPLQFNAYGVDEAVLLATTQDATSNRFRRLLEAFAQNRKLNPSYYMVYSNFFKMPNALAELMMEWIHKISKRTAEVIIPSTVIQTKEKWDKERVERYAKYPKNFRRAIKFHPSFIMEIKTPRLVGKRWENYLKKYAEYKMTNALDTDDKKAQDKKEQLFRQIDKLLNKAVVQVKSKADIANLMKAMLVKGSKVNENLATAMANDLATEYEAWKMDSVSGALVENLNKMLLVGETKE